MLCFADVHFKHRGIIQYLLGQQARNNNDGFHFDKEKKEWVSSLEDILEYNAGSTADDVDEEYIQELIRMSIKKQHEKAGQGKGRDRGDGEGRGNDGGDTESCGGYGK